MYEERKDKFSFKSFFLTLLLVLLFVFLMLWLFPTKSYVDSKLQSTYDLERLSVLYDEIFANNVGRMKDAAIGYFTNERMPQTVGQSKKLTLQEMYDLHLVLKMKDKDGNACSTTKSYVEMTKYTEEYRLKVNLSCGDTEDYIIVYLGCYNYCSSGLCEKQTSTPSTQTKIEESKTEETTKEETTKEETTKEEETKKQEETDPTPDPTPINKTYLYEYKLTVSDKTVCPDSWSNWQKTKITATDLVKVDTTTKKEVTSYKTESVPVTKTETVTKQVKERYISKYITEVVQTGTKEVQVGTTTKTVTEKVQVGTVEVKTGKVITGTISSKPTDSSTYKYYLLSTDTSKSCSSCASETYYTWEEYKINPVYDVVEKTQTVPVYKTVNVYETKSVPVYDYRTVEKKETVTKTVYETKKVAVYSNVTYYRSKTCTVKKGSTDTKWSKSNMDSTLIGKGYKLTGNVKEA